MKVWTTSAIAGLLVAVFAVQVFGTPASAKAAPVTVDGSVTATKKGDTSKGPGYDLALDKAYFVIEITNSASTSQTVVVSDPGATLEYVDGMGSCVGWTCTVDPRLDDQHGGVAILRVHVSQPFDASACLALNPHVEDTASVTLDGAPIGDQADGSVWARIDIGDCNPHFTVSKSAAPNVLPAGGGNVTYTYKVTNTGNVPVTLTSVVDDKCAPVTYVSGDTNSDNKLSGNETWTYTCTQAITASTTNTVTVTGAYGGKTLIAKATAGVVVEDAQVISSPSPSPSPDPSPSPSPGPSPSPSPSPSPENPTPSASPSSSTTNTVILTGGTPLPPTATPTEPTTTVTVTATPTERPPVSTATSTGTSVVLGEKTPGPAATPKAPEAGGGSRYDFFHSNEALVVIAFFVLSAFLSGAVVLTSGRKD